MAGENLPSKQKQSLQTDDQAINLADIGTAFILKTVKDYDTYGEKLLTLWEKEHQELDEVIQELKVVAGLTGDANQMGTPDRGMPVMESLSQNLKTRVEHNNVLQKHLEARTKFIVALKSASSVVVNVDNSNVDKSGIDLELSEILNNAPVNDYDHED